MMGDKHVWICNPRIGQATHYNDKKMLRRKKSPVKMMRGAALLMTVLLIAMLVAGAVSFLSFVQGDYHCSYLQEMKARAYYLSWSGLEYYQARPDDFPPGTAVRRNLDLDAEGFEVTVNEDKTITSSGLVWNRAGLIIAEWTLIVPQGNFLEVQDAQN